VIVWQVHDVEAEAARGGDTTISALVRVEQQQLRTGHQRGADERLGARVLVIAVHDDEPGAHASQRIARAFV